MLDNVRPLKWVDPSTEGFDKYDLLVIGGGAGGLVTCFGAALLGARCCIIERGFFGGDCLVTGCVPSKAFIKAASVVHTLKNCEQFGVRIKGEVEVDFAAVMERMRRIRADISKNDAAKRATDRYGADVFLGHASFTSRNSVNVNGKELKFNKACIATGARPAIPNIKGLESVPYCTSDNIFNLTTQPKTMLIVGAGPIGCELG
jgi:pyruvate/2-oxoglutarate dehydrogenase complex dihydrolipoamide dehydrogenase (E3) component